MGKKILLVAFVSVVFGVLAIYYPSLMQSVYSGDTYRFSINSMEYDLRKPKQKWVLPSELEEISGLSYYKENKLACIQDENGIFYVYDLLKSEIVLKETFGKNGDYEGVEVLSDTAYVLNSSGEIYYFQIEKEGIGDVNKIKTALSNDNDTEGLGFLESEKAFLIACKEDPGNKNFKIKNSRTVYGLSQSEKALSEIPKYIVSDSAYSEMLRKKGLSEKKHTPFKPSGIAVHPQSKQIFIISSVGKMMALLNPKGEIENLIPLDTDIFTQPEGICFSPNGDLYISSEGKGNKGYILKF